MNFRVGQKVVCIGTDGTPNVDWEEWVSYWKIARPSRGSVYTVRDIRAGADRQHIRLVEIINPTAEFSDAPPQEPWFWASAFRPIVERKTDITVFTEILRKATKPVPALAQSLQERQ